MKFCDHSAFLKACIVKIKCKSKLSNSFQCNFTSSVEARGRPLVQYPHDLPRLPGLDPGGGKILFVLEDLLDHVCFGPTHAGEHTAVSRVDNLEIRTDYYSQCLVVLTPGD